MNERMKKILREPANRRVYEQERLILWATEAVAKAMNRVGKTKADLARELETSPSHVTQLMSGTRNMTLRTLANLAHSCDCRVRIDFEPLRIGEFFEHPIQLVHHPIARRIVQSASPEHPVPYTDHMVA